MFFKGGSCIVLTITVQNDNRADYSNELDANQVEWDAQIQDNINQHNIYQKAVRQSKHLTTVGSCVNHAAKRQYIYTTIYTW